MVVALLVGGLLLIAGQLFVELIRRQAGQGKIFASTEGFAPFDAYLVRDAREAIAVPLTFKDDSSRDYSKTDQLLILSLPPDTDGVEKTVIYEFGDTTGLKRTLFKKDAKINARDFTTGGVVRYDELSFFARRQLLLQVYPYWDPNPVTRPAATLARFATFRNVV